MERLMSDHDMTTQQYISMLEGKKKADDLYPCGSGLQSLLL